MNCKCSGALYQCASCWQWWCLDPQCVDSAEPSTELAEGIRMCWNCRPPRGGIEIFA